MNKGVSDSFEAPYFGVDSIIPQIVAACVTYSGRADDLAGSARESNVFDRVSRRW
jgi:hypothetical protein